MRNKIVLLLIFVIILFSVIILNDKKSDENAQLKIIEIPVAKCNAQNQECITETDEFRLGISFDENIYYLKPFNVEIQIEKNNGSHINSIYVDFKMKSMNMGVNRFRLNKSKIQNKKQLWQGKALLPVCISGLADWSSKVEVITNKNKYIFSFPISVRK